MSREQTTQTIGRYAPFAAMKAPNRHIRGVIGKLYKLPPQPPQVQPRALVQKRAALQHKQKHFLK